MKWPPHKKGRISKTFGVSWPWQSLKEHWYRDIIYQYRSHTPNWKFLYGTIDANRELFFVKCSVFLSAPNSVLSNHLLLTCNFDNFCVIICFKILSYSEENVDNPQDFYTPPCSQTAIETQRLSLITVKTWASWICIWRRLVIWDIGFCEWMFNEMIIEHGRKRRANGLNIGRLEQ